MAEQIPSPESSSIDVSGRQSPTGDYICFGTFPHPSGHSELVPVPSSVDSVNDVRPNSLSDGGGIVAEQIPSPESSSIDVSGRQSPTGDYIRFGTFPLVSVLPSVDRVNDVRPNFPPDGGGTEERGRRVGKTSGPGAETFLGTDVLERFVESVVVEHLRQIAAESPNYSRERIVANLDVECVLRRAFFDQLSPIASNVTSNLLRQLLATSSYLSPEDLRVFCVPSSKKRVEFWSIFSNTLKAMGPNPSDARKVCISELEDAREFTKGLKITERG